MGSILQGNGITKTYGDLVLFEDLSFNINEGDRIALIGRNGSGKTSLLNIICGKDNTDKGVITAMNGTAVSYLEQSPGIDPDRCVIEAMTDNGSPAAEAVRNYKTATESGIPDLIEKAVVRMDAAAAWNFENEAMQILTRLKITNFNAKIRSLSGGQLKRVALAAALLNPARVLVMDEPTNHLDADMTLWLESYLCDCGKTVLLVTHDRFFLDSICNTIFELEDRKLIRYEGNYEKYIVIKQDAAQSAAAKYESEKSIYRKELEWMRRQPQARATKAKSRIESFYDLEERMRRPGIEDDIRLDVKSSYIGKKIFEVKGLSKSYGDKKLVSDFSYVFSRYEKMGIVGDNGTGKSTFVKMLMGIVPPDNGTIDTGQTVKYGYYSQEGITFDEDEKVIDSVSAIAENIILEDGRKLTASQFLNYFLFSPRRQQDFIRKLSGGEKRRLYLCTILMRNPNFLILDEPTNDLDIQTLGVLENYLEKFGGCLIVISHDRHFMDKTVDHLLIFSGDGRVKGFTGKYTEYLQWKGDNEQTRPVAKRSGSGSDDAPANDSHSRRKVKLSYKERIELESLETEIAELEKEKKHLEEKLSSGGLDHQQLLATANSVSGLMETIDDKTRRWMELSEVE